MVQSHHRMPQSLAVKQTVETLRQAKTAEDIVGRARLAEAQNHLVNLLNYLEEQEGFKLFAGERKKCGVLYEVKSTPLLQVRGPKAGEFAPTGTG